MTLKDRLIRDLAALSASPSRPDFDLIHRARVLMDAEKRHARRVAAKKAPAKKKKAETRAVRNERIAAIRAEVFARAGGRCECCGSRTPAELHHLIMGPSRRALESIETCAAVCAWCHVDLHKGKESALERMYQQAGPWASVEALNDLRYRIDKAPASRDALKAQREGT